MNMHQIDDRASAYPRFVRLHEPRVRAFVARRAGPGIEPDDIVQEAFLVAWRRFDHVLIEVPETMHLAWVCGVATRVLGHRYRSDTRRLTNEGRFISDRTVIDGDRVNGRTFAAVEERDVVERALASLNDGDRDVLLAVLWDGFSAEQIAVMLGCSAITARQRISRATRRVRKAVEQ